MRETTNDIGVGVVDRDGPSWRDEPERRALRKLEHTVVARLPDWVGPCFRR